MKKTFISHLNKKKENNKLVNFSQLFWLLNTYINNLSCLYLIINRYIYIRVKLKNKNKMNLLIKNIITINDYNNNDFPISLIIIIIIIFDDDASSKKKYKNKIELVYSIE